MLARIRRYTRTPRGSEVRVMVHSPTYPWVPLCAHHHGARTTWTSSTRYMVLWYGPYPMVRSRYDCAHIPTTRMSSERLMMINANSIAVMSTFRWGHTPVGSLKSEDGPLHPLYSPLDLFGFDLSIVEFLFDKIRHSPQIYLEFW